MVNSDQRGKSNKDRIPEEVKNDIRNHIKSFPTVSSHYCRARTNKMYIDGFHTPKKDQCALCENFKNANQKTKENIKERFEKHIKEKELSRIEKSKDVESDEIEVYCYDLQSVLPTPSGDVNSFYYKKKLATYNFTIYDVKNKKGYCYLWHEGTAKRGANEICSCVFKFITNNENENLIFYSDNCVGQNKNKFVFGMYLYCTQKFENIKSITHKFLIVGHTQNEGDGMHASNEREKKIVLKGGPLYVPSQWSVVVRNSKKRGNPYIVDEVSTNDIFDFEKLLPKIGNNFSQNTDKEKVIWKDVKIIRVEKDHPQIIFYKTSYDQLTYKQIKIKKSLWSNPLEKTAPP
ncbi:hypothetical protein NQ314_015776 [Rhamnusium bicolor]|uniref:DUF7869 domain-containing protein n=1 Tax=Rhamnusium bicolor TaxID=1586634 RepID=A0AAV8WXZ8_9CUCU|nr:hypothetical protein NQ314_015776 [Rhamnusium bicolor]